MYYMRGSRTFVSRVPLENLKYQVAVPIPQLKMSMLGGFIEKGKYKSRAQLLLTLRMENTRPHLFKKGIT